VGLVTVNLPPFKLDDLAATSSLRGFAPKIRIDPVAACTPTGRGVADNQDTARTGPVRDGRILVQPSGQPVRIRN
jgi:hypothetical protein